MAGKNLDTGNLDGARQIQQLPHKAPILQLNDETTGNTENRADHSSLFEIFVHHYLISSALFNQFSSLCFMARIKITWHIQNIVLLWTSFSIFLETFIVSFTNRLRR